MPEFDIRAIEPHELDAWWDLRLTGLRDHPEAFGSDYETSRRAGPSSYIERGYFEGGTALLIGAFTPNGEIVAQAGAFAETGKRAHIACVFSVHTRSDYRGNGLGTAVVAFCIKHLRQFPHISIIGLSVTATNTHAVKTYEKLGFVAWGEEPEAIGLPDGSRHNEIHMVLAR